MTVLDFLTALRRQWVALVVCTFVGFVGGYVHASRQPEVYLASSTLIITSNQAASTSDLAQGASFVNTFVASYVPLAQSEFVLQPVIDDLGIPTTPRALKRTVTAESPLDTTLITINVTAWDPQEAVTIANAVADQMTRAVPEVSPTIEDEAAVRATVIESASEPRFPISPNKRLLAAVGAALGLVLGVVLALVRRFLGWRVGDATDVALADPEVPTIGQVVEAVRPPSLPAAVLADPRSPEAESVRRLAVNMRHVGVGRGGVTWVITSPSPSEGKSSLACALAPVLAETSRRVLLIDADLRSPSIAELSGLDNEIGLVDVLAGEVKLASAVQEWGREGVHVLTAGAGSPNPGQLLSSDVMRSFLTKVGREYDRVIIDTAPVLLFSDAVSLGQMADHVICVARRGRTRTSALARAFDALSDGQAGASGVVITRARRTSQSSYAYANAPRSGLDAWLPRRSSRPAARPEPAPHQIRSPGTADS